MRTFFVQTLGCKVNQYESEQIAAFLRSRGLVATDAAKADLRIVNTCSVTVEAASKSRQAARRAVSLPIFQRADHAPRPSETGSNLFSNPCVVVTGCWATSHPAQAAGLSGVTHVITHHDDVARRLDQILASAQSADSLHFDNSIQFRRSNVEKVLNSGVGTHSLPLLQDRQSRHQRAFLKIQDGCDAHCTYCIIPTLRPVLWSKPIEQVIEEARRMVDAGHLEIVLTGIFLGAYGHSTALRRRQPAGQRSPLAELIEALCTRVPGLTRLRLSSIEPGDLNARLLNVLANHEQVVPHFHLPLQSGSNAILRKMNRQYSRDDFFRMLDAVERVFDRPALTTDIIAGFPGEDEVEFEQTLQVVNRARFIHIHAFPYSPRPRTAAARWRGQFVPGDITARRIARLTQLAGEFSNAFRRSFIGQTVQVLVERNADGESTDSSFRHGRCERYFDVCFDNEAVSPGELVRLQIDRVLAGRTFGSMMEAETVQCAESASI